MSNEHEEQQGLLLDDRGRSADKLAHSKSLECSALNLSACESPEYISLAKVEIYASHCLSTWGQRMWEFAIGLIMLELYPSSLALVSTFGLVDGCAQILCGSSVGRYIDRTERLPAACNMYILRNCAVALSAISALVSHHVPQGSVAFWAATLCTIGIGSVSSVSSVGAQGSTLSVEKEWTKAFCQGDSAALAQLNSGMRAVDLACLMLAPGAAGVLMTYTGITTSILVISAWNLIAWLPECYLLVCAQHAFPTLREPKLVSLPTPELNIKTTITSLTEAWRTVIEGWSLYFKQRLWPAAFSLALLYFTVLSLGLLMTAYLRWQGMTEAESSLYRGFGAMSGLIATFVFPVLHNTAGLKTTGLVGVWWQTVAYS